MRATDFRTPAAASLMALALWITGCGRSVRIPENFTLDGCGGSNGPRLWRLQPDGALRGEGTDSEGLPRPRASVRLKPAGRDSLAVQETWTDRNGVFIMRVGAPGTFLARVNAVGHGGWSDTIVVVEEAGPAPRVQLCTGPYV